MFENEKEIFKMEIELQCKFAIIAVENMNKFLNNSTATMDDFWYNIQGFLVASANISKLLWNSEKAVPELSKQLRNELEIKNNSPLRSRRFRNLFEHYDEQITDWMKSSKNKNYSSSNVTPRGSISGIDSKDMFRNYFNDENVITFRGEEYQVQIVVNEIQHVYDKLQQR